MDVFDTKISTIISTVQDSSLSDQEKADVYMELHNGLRKLVWPILLSHIPEIDLKKATDNPGDWTMDRYVDLVNKSLADPATPKEMYDELTGALDEINEIVSSRLSPHQAALG